MCPTLAHPLTVWYLLLEIKLFEIVPLIASFQGLFGNSNGNSEKSAIQFENKTSLNLDPGGYALTLLLIGRF
jgi:hypothetical protein